MLLGSSARNRVRQVSCDLRDALLCRWYACILQGSSPNFLIKNKRAVRNMALGKCQKPLPPAKKPVGHQKITPEATDLNNPTVVIMQSYLDQLLKASVNQEDKQTQLVTSTPKFLHKTEVVDQGSELWPLDTCVAAECYFPFGRPGCGAPLRSDSGQVIADLRHRTRINNQARGSGEVASKHSISPNASRQNAGEEVKQGIGEMSSPRYARGAGPHVSDYMIKEREEKRKKELDHLVSCIAP